MTTLWLDLGNTRLKYWLMNGEKLLHHDAKEHLKAPNELLLGLSGSFLGYHPQFVGISSVLGERINDHVRAMLERLGLPFEFATVKSNHSQLISRYDESQLGVDRWLQMLGAVDASCRQCVVGCGTALTIDIIDYGEHLGGYILPNVYMQRHALYAGTQQIGVKQGRFDSLQLGCTTFDAVNHGVLFGIVSAVQAIQRQYPNHKLTLTGGGAPMLGCHLQDVQIDENLLLAGLHRYFCR